MPSGYGQDDDIFNSLDWHLPRHLLHQVPLPPRVTLFGSQTFFPQSASGRTLVQRPALFSVPVDSIARLTVLSGIKSPPITEPVMNAESHVQVKGLLIATKIYRLREEIFHEGTPRC